MTKQNAGPNVGRPSRAQFPEAVAAILHSPGDPSDLLRLSAHLEKVGRTTSLKRSLIWFSSAVTAEGARGTGLARRNATLINQLVKALNEAPDRGHVLRRLCLAAPDESAFWSLNGVCFRQTGAFGMEALCIRRSLLLEPGVSQTWNDLARSVYQEDATSKGRALLLLLRAMQTAPLTTEIHRSLAALRFERLEVDTRYAIALRNSLRRSILLDPANGGSRQSLTSMLRGVGDWRDLLKVANWAVACEAAGGHQQAAKVSSRPFELFEQEVRDLAPFTVETNFQARVLAGRVLLHPKLPDSGPWVFRGPADQLKRVARVLTFANPEARIIEADDPAAADARILSLVPCDEPDSWLLPCLWGHWHVWWSVLPAILDDDGQPSLDLVLQYSIRTRQFVTFWYAKGHEHRYISQNLELARSIAARMADAASGREYMATAAAQRRSYIRRFFTQVAHRLQYFDYAVYRPGDVVLNLGVSEGFEVPAYLALISPGGTLHNIDPEGYHALGEPARAWIEGSASAVHLHELALSDVDGVIEMETGGCWEDARISKRVLGNVKTLPSKRLDTFIVENGLNRIDHINLDIEGGEGFLLDQLIAVMHSHRPQIEISIYHTIEQFFEIPDRMMRESDGYNFFFHHSPLQRSLRRRHALCHSGGDRSLDADPGLKPEPRRHRRRLSARPRATG